jgi:hypothetical protein
MSIAREIQEDAQSEEALSDKPVALRSETVNYINSNKALVAPLAHSFLLCVDMSENELILPVFKFNLFSYIFCQNNSNRNLVPMNYIPSSIWINHILHYYVSDAKFCYKMAQISRPVSLFFRQNLWDTGLMQLLQHIAYGNIYKAESIIKHNPNLLLLSGPIVKDYSGNEIQQTAWQMAIAASDVSAHFESDVSEHFANGSYWRDTKRNQMKEMIERYFKLLPDAKIHMWRQIQDLFPEGFDTYLDKKTTADLAAVTEMFDAIRNARALDKEGIILECQAALAKFKSYLKPNGVIKTGLHFDTLILVQAFELFKDNLLLFANNMDPSTSPKNVYARDKVIGLIQRNLTACDAMILCQESYSLVEEAGPTHNGEQFNRSLSYIYIDDNGNQATGVYYPLDTKSDRVLGENWAFGLGNIEIDVVQQAVHHFLLITDAKYQNISKTYTELMQSQPNEKMMMPRLMN